MVMFQKVAVRAIDIYLYLHDLKYNIFSTAVASLLIPQYTF